MSTEHSVGSMNQLADAFERAGYSADDVTRLRSFPDLGGIKSVLLGHAQIVPVDHLINCDVKPHEPSGLKVHEHTSQGMLKWDPSQVTLYLSRDQKRGKRINGTALHAELFGKRALNANVLDYLLLHPELIPESWKGKAVYFWGTIYRDSDGDLCVRCLCWNDAGWYSHYCWLRRDWYETDPAALLASPVRNP